MDFKKFKYSKDKVPAETFKREFFYEDLKKEFTDEVLKCQEHNDYFSKYDPDSVKAFLLSYAEAKVRLAMYYEQYTEPIYHNKEFKNNHYAEQLFGIIKQKKLFNLQLQWRANQIKIKEIFTSWDFLFWESEIDSCPFIPEVSSKEVMIFKQFLCLPHVNAEAHIHYGGWQNYDELTERDEEGEYVFMPDWYAYYDEHMGTAHLLLLPDTRGEQDAYYREIALNSDIIKKQREAARKNFKPYVHIPAYHKSFKNEMEYAQQFEPDPYFRELFRLNYEENKRLEEVPDEDNYSIDDDMVMEAVHDLLRADGPVAMPADSDWRAAILNCARQYGNQSLYAEIDSVYDEYKMYKEMGINRGDNFNEIWAKFLKDDITLNIWSKIKLGRKLCGEPEDFNY